jgi:hypothetical protein
MDANDRNSSRSSSRRAPRAPARGSGSARRPALAAAVALAVLVALLGVSPGLAGAAEPGAGVAEPRAGVATDAGQPRFVLRMLSERRAAAPAYVIAIAYPQLAAPAVASLQAPYAGVNAAILADVRASVSSFLAELAKFAPRPEPGQATTLTGSVTTQYSSAGLVSVTLDESSFFAGAAHPESALTTLTFDPGTGRRYELADLFSPKASWLAFLSTTSRRLLPKILGQMSVSAMIDPGTAPIASNFSGWTLTPWGLQITFGEYQVAPYAAGMPSLLLPYASLAALQRPGGPMALAVADAAAVTGGAQPMALLPAVVPPAVGLCNQPSLRYESRGAVEPLTCAGGRLNVAAWDAYAGYVDGTGQGGLRVLEIGRSTTVGAVRATMCADLGPGTYGSAGSEVGAEQAAGIYYGWHLAPSPATGFPASCKATGHRGG